MTMLITRMRELADLEGFDVEVIDRAGVAVDQKQNGFARYDFDRKMKGSATVSEWKEKRFSSAYSGYGCRVLKGDGTEAAGQTLLSTVRETYEESSS
jgi:hypothetical protein